MRTSRPERQFRRRDCLAMRKSKSNASPSFEVLSAKKNAKHRFRRLAFSKESYFRCYAALIILPDLMHRVQTFIRPLPPEGSWTRTGCRFGLNRRRVLLLACETLFPNCGPFPQTSHLC